MKDEYQQIHQIELTTDQLIMAQAMCVTMQGITMERIEKLRAEQTGEVAERATEMGEKDIEAYKKLQQAFAVAMTGAADKWGGNED